MNKYLYIALLCFLTLNTIRIVSTNANGKRYSKYKSFTFPNQLPENNYELKVIKAVRAAKSRLIWYIASTSAHDAHHTLAIKLLPCFDPFTVHYTLHRQNLRNPMNKMKTVGHVDFGNNNIYLNPSFFKSNFETRVTAIMHECSHLLLNSKDYAYRHETDKYKALTDEQRYNNADSIVERLNSIGDLT